jgi:hypothetical protein
MPVPRLLRIVLTVLGAFMPCGTFLAASPGALGAPPSIPNTYGTSQTSYVSVGEWEFFPIKSTEGYDDYFSSSVYALRFSTPGVGTFFAPLHIPDGAVLMSFELDACDSNTSGAHVTAVLLSTDSVTGNFSLVGNEMSSVSSVITPCNAYVEDLSGFGYVVDSGTSRLVVDIGTSSGDNTNAFAGVKVGYKLQVSAAPAIADFGDVPTSHPFFQFVEALYHSGITAGCGGGNFCPDSPLTRGQMAVFLAKALGLQFP